MMNEDNCGRWISTMDRNYHLNCSPQDQNRFGLLYSSIIFVVDRAHETPGMDRALQKVMLVGIITNLLSPKSAPSLTFN